MSDSIERAILALLEERADGATICPSEVARRLARDDEAAWRALMPAVRDAARRLADRGELVITQRGRVVDPRALRGPVRLRRRPI